jgi:hypothetical protein
MNERQPIPVHEIVAALEREAPTETSPQWLAAQHLRRMTDWHDRTLMCGNDQRPSEIVGTVRTGT